MSNIRAELTRLMQATVQDARNWTYHAVRPLPLPATWKPGQRVVSDCSWGARLIHRWGGGPDPMHNGWANWGNSSTIAVTNRHCDRVEDLRVGDFVTFGPGGDEHAAVVYEPGSDPNLWSDGHQGAPNFVRLSWDRREHQLRFSDLPDDVPAPPTPAERLRAKTGYWSWIAWKLGEADWRRYGKANRKVRPNVPRRIPLAWWRRFASYLLNRKKAN